MITELSFFVIENTGHVLEIALHRALTLIFIKDGMAKTIIAMLMETYFTPHVP